MSLRPPPSAEVEASRNINGVKEAILGRRFHPHGKLFFCPFPCLFGVGLSKNVTYIPPRGTFKWAESVGEVEVGSYLKAGGKGRAEGRNPCECGWGSIIWSGPL